MINIEIVDIRFPSLSGADEAKLQDLLKSTFPGKPITVSLDRLIAGVQAGQADTKTVAVKTDPPPIFVSTEPAILLTVQGVPVLAPIKGLQLQFVVNSNWDLFLAPGRIALLSARGRDLAHDGVIVRFVDDPWKASFGPEQTSKWRKLGSRAEGGCRRS